MTPPKPDRKDGSRVFRSFGMAIADRIRVAPSGPIPRRAKVVLAGEIVSVYMRVRWLMWRGDIRSTVSKIRVGSSVQAVRFEPGSPNTRLVAIRLGAAVRRTLSLLPTDSRCLVQSLVLSRLLSMRAISSTLVIGARSEPRFDAHAWVEHQGQPVLSPQGFEELRLIEM
jgi:hypothetical protein